MKREVTLSQREMSEIIADYVMENYLTDVDEVSVTYAINRTWHGDILTVRVEEK